VVLEVRETNLGAQIFYRRLGFRAQRVAKGFYRDRGEDGYIMERYF
jgi:ribosomal-protein-alanine N-acetyltransferase